MAFNLQRFKQDAIQNGGYRPALFEVRLDSTFFNGDQARFLCMSSQVPAYTHGVIEVPYFGRKIKVAGDKTYAEWTTTLMIEESFSVRDAFEEWADALNNPTSGERSGAFENEAYKSEAQIIMYGKNGDPLRNYFLEGCWPVDVGTIELDWNTTDTIGTYSVTWAFDNMPRGNQI